MADREEGTRPVPPRRERRTGTEICTDTGSNIGLAFLPINFKPTP
jgi:hypothetical protein